MNVKSHIRTESLRGPRSRRVASRVALAASLFTAAAIATAPAVHAQAGLAGTGPSLAVGGAFESYTFGTPAAAGIESVSLISLPFSARTPLVGPASLQVRGAFGRGVLVDADGVETEISGLIDTEISLGLNFRSGPVSATLSGVVVAPTGTSTHTLEAARLAAIMGSEFLPFRITNWGMGGAAGVAFTAARSVGQGSIGFGAGYLTAREFEPFSADQVGQGFVYRPGDQLQFRLAADRNFGRSSKLSLAVVFEKSAEDLLADQNLYQAGNRYQAMGSYAFTAGSRSTGIVYVGGLRSDEGTAFNPDLTHDISTRTLLLAGTGARVPLGGVVLVPSVDARVYRRGSGLGQGYLGGIGAALEIPAGSMAIAPAARARFGNYIADDNLESRVTGFDLGLEIRFGR